MKDLGDIDCIIQREIRGYIYEKRKSISNQLGISYREILRD